MEGLGGLRPPKKNLIPLRVRCSRMGVSREHGGTRFPHTPARGRVWEGAALKREYRETGFSHPPPAGGFGRAQPSQEEPMFILFVCGAAA